MSQTEMIEERLRAFVDAPDEADWQNVLQRAAATPLIKQGTPVNGRRLRLLLVAAAALAVVVIAPALAFSTTMRQLVGLSGSPPVVRHWVQATLTGAILHNPNPRPGTVITVTWTIGEPGRPRDRGFGGTGLFMRLLSKTGAPTRRIPAHGADGRYTATTRVPPGGIREIELGIIGYSVNAPGGPRSAPGLFQITNNPY